MSRPPLTRLSSDAPLLHRLFHEVATWRLRRSQTYWKLAQRLVKPPDSATLVINGQHRLSLRLADLAERSIYQGVYEQTELGLAARLVDPGGHCLDIGANIGLYSVLLGSLCGPRGRVVSFEPSPPVRERLLANTRELPQVTVLPWALGESAGQLRLERFQGNEGLATLRQSGWDVSETIPVEVRRLDDIPEVKALGPIDLLKIDVEGWEPQVFAGAPELLRSGRIRAALIEVTPDFVKPDYLKPLFPTEQYALFKVRSLPSRTRLWLRPVLLPIDFQRLDNTQFNLLVIRREHIGRVADLLAR
jgi:FkbM family methyltransferase